MTPEEKTVIESSLEVSRTTAEWEKATRDAQKAENVQSRLFQKKCNAETTHNNARRALLRSQP